MDNSKISTTPDVQPPTSPTAPPINALLSDPTVLAKISTIMSALQTNNPKPATDPSKDGVKQGSPDGLATVLSDPNLLEKLPQMIATLKPLLDSGLLSPPNAVQASVSAPSSIHERDNLLLSLKPFLSSGRRDAVDAILRIEKLGEILKQIK